MKKLYFIIAMALISLSNVLIAQPYTATLEHGTTTQVFYGNLAFNAANAAAVDGDVIVLSAGNLGSATISKKIKVIGTGHYPNPVNTIPTTVNVTLGPGSDSCLIEGITTGTISNTAPVRAVHISRCKITTINLSAGSRSCIIEGNVLYNINCYNNDTVNIIRNNIFSTSAQGSYTPALGSFYNGSIIENNVFYLHCSDIGLAYCIIRNNIIFSTAGCGYGTSATYGCLIQNNFTAINGSPGSFFNNSTNTVQNPYTGTITFNAANAPLYNPPSVNNPNYQCNNDGITPWTNSNGIFPVLISNVSITLSEIRWENNSKQQSRKKIERIYFTVLFIC